MPHSSALPARRRDEGSAATRRAILAAAEYLLERHGEDGLSIREVCARAGVTPPTIYHHFGDKAALVDRVVDRRFAEFDRTFEDAGRPVDPVEALRWGFQRYIEYGIAHPAHYRLIFQRAHVRPTPAGLASYDRLRRAVAAVDAAGRLLGPVEPATAACWAAVHGITTLVIAGFLQPDTPAATLVCEAILRHLTRPTTRRARRAPGRQRRN